jgi:hypothetical protein
MKASKSILLNINVQKTLNNPQQALFGAKSG